MPRLGAPGTRGAKEKGAESVVRADGGGGRLPAHAGARPEKPFLMSVEDVFSITGRGTVVTGRVEREPCGSARRSRSSGSATHQKTTVTGVEMFRKLPRRGPGGRQRRACCSAASARTTWSAARSWSSPGSITPHTEFEAQVYVLTKDEGGRHNPFFDGYRPSSTSARPT